MWGRRALAAGLIFLATPGAARAAVSQQQAVTAAVRGHAVNALVYVTPAPLARGARVVEAGPGAWAVGKPRRSGHQLVTKLRPWVVRRAAWLVWQDLLPGAAFVHPGRLVLVDATTGRVARQSRTSWWPRVNGLDPPGFGTSERKFAFAPLGGAPARAAAQLRQAGGGLPVALPALPNDCMVVGADQIDDLFAKNISDMVGLGIQLGIPVAKARSYPTFAQQVEEFEKQGCNDVVLALIGHGSAGPGQYGLVGDVLATDLSPTVHLGWKQQTFGPFVKDIHSDVTLSDLERIVDRGQRRGTTFKIIIDSCFSGRFSPIAKRPGVAVVATSSGAKEPTWGPLSPNTPVGTTVVNSPIPGFTHLDKPSGAAIGGSLDPGGGGITGPIAALVAGELVKNGGNLAAAIASAAANKALSVAARLGITHPQVTTGVSGKVITKPIAPACTPLDAALSKCNVPVGQVLLDVAILMGSNTDADSVTVSPPGTVVTTTSNLPRLGNPSFQNVLAFVADGTTVTLKATPDPGRSAFDGWRCTDNGITGPYTCSFVVRGGEFHKFHAQGVATFLNCPKPGTIYGRDSEARDCPGVTATPTLDNQP